MIKLLGKSAEVWKGVLPLLVLIIAVGGCIAAGVATRSSDRSESLLMTPFAPSTSIEEPAPTPSQALEPATAPVTPPVLSTLGAVRRSTPSLVPMSPSQARSTFTPAYRPTNATRLTATPSSDLLTPPVPTPTLHSELAAIPGPTPDGIVRVLRVPILMYHYVSEPPPDADVYRLDLSVTPQRFESHLQYLAEAGYHTITLDDLLYALAQGRPLPAKPIILTFDDGYEDHYRNVFPLLQKYGMVGHFSIITDFVNQGRPEYMTWPQIEEMAAAGQRFGSHSRDHPDLAGKSVDYLVWQALGGMEAIQEHLGYHPRWITYPSGSYDQQVIAVYRSAGYWGGLTTHQGATHTLAGIFELKRVRVRGTHTAADLAALLALDW